VSVVIRCFNEERHIGTLLDRIARQTLRDHEVVVVDSGSTDDTLRIVQQFPARIVPIRPDDFTFGYSLNRGCERAVGEYVVIASAHVVPCSDTWLEQLVAPFADPSVALVYGRQQGHETSKFSERQLFAKQFPQQSNWNQRTPFCNNANAAIRRALWVGHPYDESLSGLEDLAWAKWCLEQGHRIAYNADAAVVHIHEERPQQIRRRYMREALAFRRIFPDSHVTVGEFVSLLASSVVADLLAALRQGQLSRHAASILMFRTMQYWGTFRGMNYRSPLTHELIMQFYYPRPARHPEASPDSQTRMEVSYDPTHR
jgi:glycosyltransferase involved in cell wall biosynthesis